MRRVMFAMLLLIMAGGCFGSASPQPPSTPIRPAGWRLHRVEVTGVRVRSIPADYPYSLAAGARQVWVGIRTGVARIDAAARLVRLVARIPNSAEWYNLAYASGSVWYMPPRRRTAFSIASMLRPEVFRSLSGSMEAGCMSAHRHGTRSLS